MPVFEQFRDVPAGLDYAVADLLRQLKAGIELLRQLSQGQAAEITTKIQLVDRGDPSGYDFTSFTTDANWHDLDLSSVVPAGAKLVLLHVWVVDGSVGSGIVFRKNGNSNSYNESFVSVQAATVTAFASIWVFCDANRVIEYLASNITFTSISVVVGGWIL